ncbi:MAG: efflux RND transporter periplasmic adaptor subunit [Flavobacteriaceae bacterium]|nr:efflux RND transporter periplasmic adaptor subunit [Flavobacteriaceae bacterium]
MKNKFLLTTLICTLLLTSCGEEKKEEVKSARPVSFQEVGFQGGENVRTFNGTSKTDEVVNLTFRSGGIITELNLKIGQQVKKGELLAKLDNVQARLNYENAVSSLNSAASQMNTAKLGLDRIRSLYEKGSSSLSDYESAKNSYRTAKASYESSTRSVSIQQEQIKYGYINAPANGIIAFVDSEINENVSAGQVIAILNVSGDMEISLGIPESIINYVSANMKVELSFPSILNKTYQGQVSEVSPSIDNNTSTYPIKVRIVDPTKEIKSGMATNVTFNFKNENEITQSLIVPANSVGEDGNGQFVFVLNEKENEVVANKVQIKIGKLTSEGFEVLEGLEPGQKIATAGLQTLLDGQIVTLF